MVTKRESRSLEPGVVHVETTHPYIYLVTHSISHTIPPRPLKAGKLYFPIYHALLSPHSCINPCPFRPISSLEILHAIPHPQLFSTAIAHTTSIPSPSPTNQGARYRYCCIHVSESVIQLPQSLSGHNSTVCRCFTVLRAKVIQNSTIQQPPHERNVRRPSTMKILSSGRKVRYSHNRQVSEQCRWRRDVMSIPHGSVGCGQ